MVFKGLEFPIDSRESDEQLPLQCCCFIYFSNIASDNWIFAKEIKVCLLLQLFTIGNTFLRLKAYTLSIFVEPPCHLILNILKH